jgi:hypothetical protein
MIKSAWILIRFVRLVSPSRALTLIKAGDEDVEKLKSLDEIVFEKKVWRRALTKQQLQKSLGIPTDDQTVRNRLRELFEPMTLFSEGPMERRDRLKELVAEMVMEGQEMEWEQSSDEDEGQKEEYYTYGSEELRDSRQFILDFSMERFA